MLTCFIQDNEHLLLLRRCISSQEADVMELSLRSHVAAGIMKLQDLLVCVHVSVR